MKWPSSLLLAPSFCFTWHSKIHTEWWAPSPSFGYLAQAPRSVRIESLEQGEVVGQHLRGQGVQYRRKLLGAGDRHPKPGGALVYDSRVLRDNDQLGSPVGQVFDECLDAVTRPSGRDDGDNREVAPDHCYRAVSEVCCGETFGDHVGSLHQLERRLFGGGEVVASRGHYQVLRVTVASGVLPPALREHGSGVVGKASHGCSGFLFTSKRGDQEVEQQELGGVRLRRRDALLSASVEGKVDLGGPGQRRSRVVRDGEGARSELSGPADCFQDVLALSRLAYADHQDTVEVHASFVKGEGRGRRKSSGYPQQHLKEVLGV